MKIAFVISPDCPISGVSNGVRGQAQTWRDGLAELGVEVTLVNPWEGYEWDEFDVVHIFHYGPWLESFVTKLRPRNPNIILSPVIDSNSDPRLYRWFAALPVGSLRLYSIPSALRNACAMSRGILARSRREADILGFGRADFQRKLQIVPIAYSEIADVPQAVQTLTHLQSFCLHVSSWYQERKNVLRLLEAFQSLPQHLVIAGNPGAPEQSATIRQMAAKMQNVTLLERVSRAELRWLYSRTAVFCLPSLREGVGLVALEAAHYGAEVVVTRRGGPADYFRDVGILIDPQSTESIRTGIVDALRQPRQPALGNHVRSEFSSPTSAQRLRDAYQHFLSPVPASN